MGKKLDQEGKLGCVRVYCKYPEPKTVRSGTRATARYAYLIQIPKDQILKYLSPENGPRYYQSPSKQKTRRTCCCFILCFLLLFLISAGVLYLLFHPESLDYSISLLLIQGLNLTSPNPLSPAFDVSVRVDNKNNKLGIYYEEGSRTEIYSRDTELANGVMPVFYQGSNNVTVLRLALKDNSLLLGDAVKSRMRSQERQGNVPFLLKLRAPVKIKIGSIKTWKITVQVNCDIAVDMLTEKSKDCF